MFDEEKIIICENNKRLGYNDEYFKIGDIVSCLMFEGNKTVCQITNYEENTDMFLLKRLDNGDTFRVSKSTRMRFLCEKLSN